MAPRSKKPKDSNAPKRALSAYFLFANDKRAQVKLENPTLRMTQISGKVAELWANTPSEDKRVYQERAAKDKERYNSEMEVYKASDAFKEHQKHLQEYKLNKKKAEKFGKDPNMPKRPISAFMLYANTVRSQVRAANPSLSIGDTGKKIGEMWNSMPEDQKEEWKKKSKEGLDEWQKEVEAYKATPEYTEYQDARKEFNKKRKADILNLEGGGKGQGKSKKQRKQK